MEPPPPPPSPPPLSRGGRCGAPSTSPGRYVYLRQRLVGPPGGLARRHHQLPCEGFPCLQLDPLPVHLVDGPAHVAPKVEVGLPIPIVGLKVSHEGQAEPLPSVGLDHVREGDGGVVLGLDGGGVEGLPMGLAGLDEDHHLSGVVVREELRAHAHLHHHGLCHQRPHGYLGNLEGVQVDLCHGQEAYPIGGDVYPALSAVFVVVAANNGDAGRLLRGDVLPVPHELAVQKAELGRRGHAHKQGGVLAGNGRGDAHWVPKLLEEGSAVYLQGGQDGDGLVPPLGQQHRLQLSDVGGGEGDLGFLGEGPRGDVEGHPFAGELPATAVHIDRVVAGPLDRQPLVWG